MRRELAAVGLGVILSAKLLSAQPHYPLPPAMPVPPSQYPIAPPMPPASPQYPIAPGLPAPPQFPSQPAIPIPPRVPSQPIVPASPSHPAPALAPITAPPPRLLPPSMRMGVAAPGLPNLGEKNSTSPKPGSLNVPPVTKPEAITEIPLPHPEQKFPIRAMDVTVKRAIGSWQVWAGQKMLGDFGDNETNARDVARVYRDLRPTEWITIGGPKPVVEYGLTNGKPAVTGVALDDTGEQNPAAPSANAPVITGAGAKFVQSIDLKTARIEPIRGVWCVRDDDNILFNFGPNKADAEQTLAVIQKYGFNRIGVVGTPTQPAMSFLYVSLEQERANKLVGGQLLVNAQINALTRTGIPVPGVGYVGEMVKIDPRKVEVRKDGTDWVMASGQEVLGRYGPTEWAAREAARTVSDARFTEFCKLGGTSNLTFFLANGKAPIRAPYSTHGRSFNPGALKVEQINQKWAITENRRPLFDVGSPQEGETVVRVIQHYGFDQICNLSPGGTKGVMFLIKNR